MADLAGEEGEGGLGCFGVGVALVGVEAEGDEGFGGGEGELEDLFAELGGKREEGAAGRACVVWLVHRLLDDVVVLPRPSMCDFRPASRIDVSVMKRDRCQGALVLVMHAAVSELATSPRRKWLLQHSPLTCSSTCSFTAMLNRRAVAHA